MTYPNERSAAYWLATGIHTGLASGEALCLHFHQRQVHGRESELSDEHRKIARDLILRWDSLLTDAVVFAELSEKDPGWVAQQRAQREARQLAAMTREAEDIAERNQSAGQETPEQAEARLASRRRGEAQLRAQSGFLQ